MTIVNDALLPPCAHEPAVFLDDDLQAPPRGTLTASTRRTLHAKMAAAHRRCAGCPQFIDCLYRSVVEVNISGYVACTTESDRQAIRRRLGVRVVETEATQFGAPRVGGGPVSHEIVMATRNAHPEDTCQQLAERLGCSPSTVKRHLRRARQQAGGSTKGGGHAGAEPRRPSVNDVLDAFDELDRARARQRADQR